MFVFVPADAEARVLYQIQSEAKKPTNLKAVVTSGGRD